MQFSIIAWATPQDSGKKISLFSLNAVWAYTLITGMIGCIKCDVTLGQSKHQVYSLDFKMYNSQGYRQGSVLIAAAASKITIIDIISMIFLIYKYGHKEFIIMLITWSYWFKTMYNIKN